MTHKAFLIAETKFVVGSIVSSLIEIGAEDWALSETGLQRKVSDSELLVEFMGRLCYKSFAPGLNPNVTKVREGNDLYIANVLKQKHGSVLEHATCTFAVINASRIFTHELVRHRPGTAYSQESQRFVRLDEFKLYIPDLTDALSELGNHDDEWVQQMQDRFVKMTEEVSADVKGKLAAFIGDIGLDNGQVSFHVKKQITSALRRLLPGGVNTNIGITSNHRSWRHMIQNRTAVGAEVEIREVFADIAEQLKGRYPNLYQDMSTIKDDSGPLSSYVFANEKV